MLSFLPFFRCCLSLSVFPLAFNLVLSLVLHISLALTFPLLLDSAFLLTVPLLWFFCHLRVLLLRFPLRAILSNFLSWPYHAVYNTPGFYFYFFFYHAFYIAINWALSFQRSVLNIIILFLMDMQHEIMDSWKLLTHCYFWCDILLMWCVTFKVEKMRENLFK